MAVWKRFNGKRVKRGSKDYDRATWVAEGKVDSIPYKKALPKESVKTAEQARAKDDEIRMQIRSGTFSQANDKTRFTEYVDSDFLPYCDTNRAAPNQQHYECAKLKAYFKNTPLKAITPSACEGFKRWRTKQYVKCAKCVHGVEHQCEPRLVQHSTVNRELTTLKSIFHRARADRKITENPMDFVPKFPENPPRERFLTADERIRLFDAVKKKYQLHCYVLIGLYTGWRRNQILHLRVADLDNGFVWVPKQKRKDRRRVPVNSTVWNVLSGMADIREDWLFIHPSGKRLVDPDDAWRAALKEAGIKDFRFHDLRHSFATTLLENNLSEFAIQHALGHSRIQTTGGYAHVKDEHLRLGLEAMKTDDIPLPSAIQTPTDSIM